MRTEGISLSHPTYSKKASVHSSQHQSSSLPEVSTRNRFGVLQEMETASRDVVSKETLKKTKGENTTIALNEMDEMGM